MVDFLLFKSTENPVSYDLGWLIQNEKVSDEELCRLLVNETSPEIDRLVSRILKSPADRIGVIDRAIFTLLLKRHSYKGNISGRAWLYRLVFDQCMNLLPKNVARRSRNLPFEMAIEPHLADDAHFSPFLNSITDIQRMIVTLHYGQNLTASDISFLCKIRLETIQSNLEQSQRELMAHQRACNTCSAQISNFASMETSLSEAFQNKSALIGTALQNSADWIDSILRRLEHEKNKQRTRLWLSRAAEIGLGLLILVFAELTFSQSWPIFPWAVEPIEITTNQEPPIEPTFQPTPAPTFLPSHPVTARDSAVEEIIFLTKTSWTRWQTLWADVQVVNFKVENYSDGSVSIPTVILRKQIWLSLPGSSRIISGPSHGNPDISYSISKDTLTGQNFEEGQTIEQQSPELIPDQELQKLFSPVDIINPGGKFILMGKDVVANRPAWVLDWFDQGRRIFRYWVDQGYGVVLRRVEFGDGMYQPVISEIGVADIFFNASFPADIFEPFRYRGDYFAYNLTGDPEINDLKTTLQNWTTPPVKLEPPPAHPFTMEDFSSARLSFINVPGGWMQSTNPPGVELFANQYDVGRLRLDGKSIQTCQRSPDGNRIAYNSPPKDGSGDTALFIADLDTIIFSRPALEEGITSGDYAFSPDSKSLAFFGCEKTSNFCGIFILDIASSKLTRLTPLSYADYIIWSPDSRSIALVGKDDFTEAREKLRTQNLSENEVMVPLHTWNFQVIDTRSGYVTYKRFFDWPNLSAPEDSPTRSWSTPFKIHSGGVNGCINPPGKGNSN